MRVSIIAAIGENRELGKNNHLIWKFHEDLQRFKRLTTGHPIIMGRKTFESIGRVLPERLNVIISREHGLAIAGAEVVSSVEEAIERVKKIAPKTKEIFIIGGGQIYAESMPHVDRLYLTLIHKTDLVTVS